MLNIKGEKACYPSTKLQKHNRKYLLTFKFASSDMTLFRGIKITTIMSVKRNKAWIYDKRYVKFIKKVDFFITLLFYNDIPLILKNLPKTI